jgi:hypothetical protein
MNRKEKELASKAQEVIDDNWMKIDYAVDKIYKSFHDYGWTWGDKDKIPTRKEMEDCINELIKTAIEINKSSSDDVFVETGRIAVRYFDKVVDIYLSVI